MPKLRHQAGGIQQGRAAGPFGKMVLGGKWNICSTKHILRAAAEVCYHERYGSTVTHATGAHLAEVGYDKRNGSPVTRTPERNAQRR